MADCFKAVGTNPEHAEIVAANLLEADYRGHYSHGMNRLGNVCQINIQTPRYYIFQSFN